jgi:hypothetical protein
VLAVSSLLVPLRSGIFGGGGGVVVGDLQARRGLLKDQGEIALGGLPAVQVIAAQEEGPGPQGAELDDLEA